MNSFAHPQLVRAWEETGKIERDKDETARHFQETVDQRHKDEVENRLAERRALASDEDLFWGEDRLAISWCLTHLPPGSQPKKQPTEIIATNQAFVVS